MKTYTHRVVQLLAALAGVTSGSAVVVSDPHDLTGWLTLLVGAVVGVVTFYRQVSDPLTPTLPSGGPATPPVTGSS